MIELVFVACLSIAPDTCESRALQFADMSMVACTMGAQSQLALWVGDHPGWQIQRWTCQPMGPDRRT